MISLSWRPERRRAVRNGRYDEELREPRVGVCLHYDGSGSDESAVSWFEHPDCRVSYQELVLDDGSYVTIAPDDARAWHAGFCRTSDPERIPYEDANSALYGIAAATNEARATTALQLLAVAWRVRRWFRREGWSTSETWRIVGHHTEAVFPPDHPRAGERGRKSDPTGADPDVPIMSVDDVRTLVPLLGGPDTWNDRSHDRRTPSDLYESPRPHRYVMAPG